MSLPVESAFEVGSGIAFYDDDGNAAGIYFGVTTPEVSVPEAPKSSLYIRSNGLIYRRTNFTAVGHAADWSTDFSAGGVSGGLVPFCLTDGTESNIPLTPPIAEKSVDFLLSDSTPSNLLLVSDNAGGYYEVFELTNGVSSNIPMQLVGTDEVLFFYLSNGSQSNIQVN